MRPNDFVPERWYSEPELIKSKNAYAPFSLGKLISFSLAIENLLP